MSEYIRFFICTRCAHEWTAVSTDKWGVDNCILCGRRNNAITSDEYYRSEEEAKAFLKKIREIDRYIKNIGDV